MKPDDQAPPLRLREEPAPPSGSPRSSAMVLLGAAARTEPTAAEMARGWMRLQRQPVGETAFRRGAWAIRVAAFAALIGAGAVWATSRGRTHPSEVVTSDAPRARALPRGEQSRARWLVPAAAPAVRRPAPLPARGSLLWSTDHETGDFAGWQVDGRGRHSHSGGGQIAVTSTIARSGRFALGSRLSEAATFSHATVARDGPFPREAFYRAWFHIPAGTVAPQPWWTIMSLRSRVEPDDPSTWVDVWALTVGGRATGALRPNLFMHGSGGVAPLGPPDALPIGRWFAIELFVRAATDDTGRLVVWIDGKPVFDVHGRPTMPSPFLSWTVGSMAAAGQPAGIFMDDADIHAAEPASADR